MTPLEALEQFCPERLEQQQEQRSSCDEKQQAAVEVAATETCSDEEVTSAPSEEDTESSSSSSAASSQQPQQEEAEQECCDNDDEDVDPDEMAPPAFICPLTLQIMRDPVLSRYGQNFERAAILQWLCKNNTCPLTRRPLELRQLIANHQLRLQIRRWQLAHDFDIQLVMDAPLDDYDDELNNITRRRFLFGYIDLQHDDEAERSGGDDPRVILEYRPDNTAGAAAAPPQPRRRRRRRRGWLGRLVRRAVTTTART